MKDQIIVNPSNFIDAIYSNESKVYLMSPGNYHIDEIVTLNNRCMITALDYQNRPKLIFNKIPKNRPGIHVISEGCYISNLEMFNYELDLNTYLS